MGAWSDIMESMMTGEDTMHSEEATWQCTPRWHPASWIGYRWRKRMVHGYDPDWEYRTNRQHARWVLAMQFNNGDLGSEHHVSKQ